MRHFTKIENQQIREAEVFLGVMEDHLEITPIGGKEAKILQNALKISLRSAISAKVHLLNLRYTFASHSDYRNAFPSEIKAFIDFLEKHQEATGLVDWGLVLQRMDITWRAEA
jgi:hypothetical protein